MKSGTVLSIAKLGTLYSINTLPINLLMPLSFSIMEKNLNRTWKYLHLTLQHWKLVSHRLLLRGKISGLVTQNWNWCLVQKSAYTCILALCPFSSVLPCSSSLRCASKLALKCVCPQRARKLSNFCWVSCNKLVFETDFTISTLENWLYIGFRLVNPSWEMQKNI